MDNDELRDLIAGTDVNDTSKIDDIIASLSNEQIN